jgi:hypothetical protein
MCIPFSMNPSLTPHPSPLFHALGRFLWLPYYTLSQPLSLHLTVLWLSLRVNSHPISIILYLYWLAQCLSSQKCVKLNFRSACTDSWRTAWEETFTSKLTCQVQVDPEHLSFIFIVYDRFCRLPNNFYRNSQYLVHRFSYQVKPFNIVFAI